MDGLNQIIKRVTETQKDLQNNWDKDVRRGLWLEFEALYLEFLDSL